MCTFALFGSSASASASSSWSWSGKSSLYTVANNDILSGAASFSMVPDGAAFDLVIVLQNTAALQPLGTADILTGLYFDLSSATSTPGALSMYSAVADLGLLTTGSNQTSPTSGTAGTNSCAKPNFFESAARNQPVSP